MSEPEPRRSVRATKGQHKALEQLDQAIETPKKRGGTKKSKKAAPEPEEPEEEIIRCVCGATEQDEDSGEPWIACDQCGAWQHNICMGMSQYTEDLPKEYFCELCRPENHRELLAGIAKGEKPWEARRKAYEEEKAEKKKKGPKKGKKRASDLKDEASQKSKQSPPPPPSEPKKDVKGAGAKRKNADGGQDKETKKMRKINETQSVPIPGYSPPADIAARISELPGERQGPAKALSKALTHSLGVVEKKGAVPSDGVSSADRAERFALQIERAVHDTHPTASSYASQVRTLAFNLKSNSELTNRLLDRSLTPPMLASMSTEELASKELQKETAELRAKAEKQAIKITEDVPRVRRTHKGEEMVGDDGFIASEEVPSAPAPRPGAPKQEPRESPGFPAQAGLGRPSATGLAVDTLQSPSRADFDLNRVFSTVKSPTLPREPTRASFATAPTSGPGVDPDVDRLLDDGTQSPPYSPKEESDPDVVWRGTIVMSTIAEVPVAAKHIGGANLNETLGLAWDELIPRNLTVCGRIEEQQAIVYLCSLRYSLATDIVVVNLEPTTPAAKAGMQKLVDYFVSKKRYGVVGDKGVANVRDTYLVPVLPGTGNHPEFMLNLADNFIPETRTEPMMLCVFVFRNGKETMQRIHGTTDPNHAPRTQQNIVQTHDQVQSQSPGTPTPIQGGFSNAGRQKSISAPAFSPTSPQGPFQQYPSPRTVTPAQQPQPLQVPAPQSVKPAPSIEERQRQGEAIARDILGHLMTSPTVHFLLPQAHVMTRKEWEIIKKVYEKDPRTRDDLPYLSECLEKETNQGPQQQGQPQPQSQAPSQPQPQPHPHLQQHPQQQGGPQAPQLLLSQQTYDQHHQQQQQHLPPPRTTPIPPPPIPPVATAGPPRQTPIPPPPIPPQATTNTIPPKA
ncbi:transcription factor S-II, central domain-containing protein [Chaetomium strumarium]|uniref:Transcription factor BYE1 n=1 Tax=Chaetomium strumarium TaxID=1170767 RepID=A0AAJ0LZQ4_9PEZI|nr:transcription factor S-II, central domain-containing protein [Chaetomium strumarium]